MFCGYGFNHLCVFQHQTVQPTLHPQAGRSVQGYQAGKFASPLPFTVDTIHCSPGHENTKNALRTIYTNTFFVERLRFGAVIRHTRWETFLKQRQERSAVVDLFVAGCFWFEGK